MVVSISVAKEWFVSMSEGRMLLPEQEVRILVLSGLTKQPIFVPSLSISWQKNCISSWGTVEWVDEAADFLPEFVKFLAEKLYIFVGDG